MGKSKAIEAADLIAGWTKEEIEQLELAFLYKMFHCDSEEGVDVTVAFARYMSRVKLDSDNYPVFLKLLQFENHWGLGDATKRPCWDCHPKAHEH